MTPDSSLLFEKKSVNNVLDIYIVDGSHMSVSHVGSISISTLSIPSTYLILKLSLNLLSIGQLV